MYDIGKSTITAQSNQALPHLHQFSHHHPLDQSFPPPTPLLTHLSDSGICLFIGFQATALTLPGEHHCHRSIRISYHLTKKNNWTLIKKRHIAGWWNIVLTFTPAGNETIITPTKTTPNDMTMLSLTRIFIYVLFLPYRRMVHERIELRILSYSHTSDFSL